MLAKIITLIVLARAIRGNILEDQLNYQKPKLERNNVLNKGVWVRNNIKENLFDRTKTGDFIFRENSLDADNLIQSTYAFDPFAVSNMDDSPRVSNYVKRAKRAIRRIREQRLRKSLKNCIGKDCQTYIIEEQNELRKDPVKRDGKGGRSALNDNPYEVASLLNNNKKETSTPRNYTKFLENVINENNDTLDKSNDIIQKPELSVEANFKINNDTVTKNKPAPRRSKKYDLESEVIKKFEFIEDINKNKESSDHNESKIIDRNIFDKDNTVWHQNAPIPDINIYKVVPKEPQKSKAVTERGLIKVISMLTKTFKKIMKQHTEIKDIYERITEVYDQFVKNAGSITKKFQDFDIKYLNLLKFHERLKIFDAKLATKQEYFKNKEREMANNFKEFENQQKKFLQQQRQFYNIQKVMLAQNEKINIKQNAIAKTQSEISHRQNNFARILKKAKQFYLENKNPITKLKSNFLKSFPNTNPIAPKPYISSTAPSTESVKINLFSIPISNKIENQDDLIMKEKDDQTIDDLVYKYYFNNTFIDNVMKNNVLSSLMGVAHNPGVPRNMKSKRNEFDTTILLPVYEDNDSEEIVSKNRERRWISHHSKHKGKRRQRGKGLIGTQNTTDADAKPIRRKAVNTIVVVEDLKKVANIAHVNDHPKTKNDPFLTMAKKFCNEIHQNVDAQMLNLCMEKSLRRLRFLDFRNVPMQEESILADPAQLSHKSPTTMLPSKPWTPMKTKKHTKTLTKWNIIPDTGLAIELNTVKIEPSTVSVVPVTETTAAPSTQPPSSTTVGTTVLAPITPIENATKATLDSFAFFPDNEKLESNLKQYGNKELSYDSNVKQYDLKPDVEGNVYYDGSYHTSDLHGSDSQGLDDIMPGIESNSRIDMDPLAFDLQAQRRAIVRKLNEKIKKSLG